jgi:DNA polymerase-3 subunit alpha
MGQFDLFGAPLLTAPPVPAMEWDKPERLAFEREMLGLYVSDHPLRGLEHVLRAAADRPIAALAEEGTVPDGAVVRLAGILSGVQRRVTRQGRPWAQAVLEDLDGSIEVMFFPDTYELVDQWVAEDAVVSVKGRVDRREEVPRLMAMDLTLPDLTAPPPPLGSDGSVGVAAASAGVLGHLPGSGGAADSLTGTHREPGRMGS